ncbi:cache domain-containing protein [Vogesella sp. DC21W]|uniref:histidine kinase n=1 Tax=Vogesella aquatica TaxID=2984206 RepID=A0ABT5IVQ3_9NEIS|nr:ATP-binding protein [Vogesella aquatica]MDC7716636.1 cache domain-containing protein [Vogesella aquatica]
MFRLLLDMITSRIRKPLVWVSVLLLLVLLFSLMTYRISFRAGTEALRESGNRQLELHARGVESEIERYIWLPRLLGLHTATRQLLQQDNPGIRTEVDNFSTLRREVNEYLDGMSTRSGTLALFVLDGSGRVLAASNWRRNDSSVGEDMSQRPYFVEAMAGGQGQFYGLDSLSGEPGYYLSSPLRIGDRIIGVAVAKVRLSQLEQGWRKANSNALVTDENGVVILSTNPDWYLRALHPISAERREQLARSLQYHWSPLPILSLAERVTLSPGVEQWGVGDAANPLRVHRYLVQSRTLNDTRWQLTMLSPLNDVRSEALTHALLSAAIVAFLTLLIIAMNERRKALATKLAAREALEEANSELERRITERTADLKASNDRLRAEIRERELAEQSLRKTQNELIQAGKLAVIGQMSTSIAHELNQPLAALRTLSGNTVKFLQRGAHDVAAANLQTIGELVERMGKITASLRSFARRSEHAGGRARLAAGVDAALFLLHPRLSREPVTVINQLQDVELAIDQTRLEQILVNLLANAMDALQGRSEPTIILSGRQQGSSYALAVSDNGCGLPQHVMQHLFEPFFTTKPADRGLGLGLTLSASLAAAADGALKAGASASGGAEFTLTLPLYAGEDVHHA